MAIIRSAVLHRTTNTGRFSTEPDRSRRKTHKQLVELFFGRRALIELQNVKDGLRVDCLVQGVGSMFLFQYADHLKYYHHLADTELRFPHLQQMRVDRPLFDAKTMLMDSPVKSNFCFLVLVFLYTL